MKYTIPFAIFTSLLLFSCTKKNQQKPEVIQTSSTSWSSKVTYEIFIQSFADSDGDGIGDIKGATSKLSYLQELGIEAVWLMPIMKSPSYHKYDVTDYESIHPNYGTLNEFKTFVSEAHQKGISVIVDLIINHTSNKHPWFLESQKGKDNPYRDYYVWAHPDSIKDDLSKRTISLDSDNITQWHNSENNEALYYGFFHGGMPDLNYDNPKVLKEIFDIGKFWLEEVGVDGFRMDAAKHIFRDHRAGDNHQFWKKFKQGMQEINLDVYIVGEVWADAKTAAPYSEGLPVLFNFDMASSILETLRKGKVSSTFVSGHAHGIVENSSLIETFIQNRKTFLSTNPDFIDGIFLSNHDQNRVMSELGNDVEKAKVAASILLTLPGQPYIYYGEEIGMTGRKPDEQIREPFLWDKKENDSIRTSWIDPKYSLEETVVPAKLQAVDSTSLLYHYRKLIKIRKEYDALALGDIAEVGTKDDRILSYRRTHKNQSFVVLHNVSKDEIILDIAEIPVGYEKTIFSFNNPEIESKNIKLPPLSSMVLSHE